MKGGDIMINNEISIVIGSCGSYNECNERAFGSKWLTLSDFSDWDEIEAELVKQGFELDGIDEELFIQDIEGIEANENWDYVNPQSLFELFKDSGVLDSAYKYEIMQAFIEVRSFKEFEELVSAKGSDWDTDINVYRSFDWQDYGREMFELCGYEIPAILEDFIDFEAYGRYVGEYVDEYSNGLIEIL
jgi:hypothetical protein